jgi:cation diffusion facilitator family transporter
MNKKQAKVLWIVLFINAAMFLVEFAGGIFARSLALSGDSLDMLGDAIAYGSSIYVINKGSRAKTLSASLKGMIMIVSAIVVLAQAVYRLIKHATPEVSLMSSITILALMANMTCLALLTRFKNDDLNMSSVWLCSRNDLIANSAVLAAAGLVWWTGSSLPDLIVGLGITALFLHSGLSVLSKARAELQPSARA